MKSNTKIIHLCDCGIHGLAVSRVEWKEGDVDIQIAVWTLGRHGRCSCWKCRFCHIWNIVRTGFPYLDDWVVMRPSAARELAEHILEAAGEVNDHQR